MVSFSSSSSSKRHAIRSISLPTRSHHTTLQVEEELTNLQIWESSLSCIPDVDTFCIGLTYLERLYTCVDNLLSLQLTQQVLSHNQHQKLVDALLVQSITLLDICGSIKEVVSQLKTRVSDIQSAQRRRKEYLNLDAFFLQKLKHNAKKAVENLKQIDHIYGSKVLNLDNHIFSVIKVLIDVSEVSTLVFRLLFSFMSVVVSKLKSKGKWAMVFRKLIIKGAGSKYQPQICAEALDFHVEGIENGLVSVFRSLIRTRASLLNIKSQ